MISFNEQRSHTHNVPITLINTINDVEMPFVLDFSYEFLEKMLPRIRYDGWYGYFQANMIMERSADEYREMNERIQ